MWRLFEELRGQGIGRCCLNLPSGGPGCGLTKCSLTVDLGNEKPFHYMSGLDIKKMATIHEKLLPSKIHYRGYYRMVKNLYPVVNP
jgi:hypothetical protein